MSDLGHLQSRITIKEMKIHTLIRAACLVFALTASIGSEANMVLSNVIVHFEPGQPNRQDVEISNQGEDTLYVEVEPHEMIAPGTGEEGRTPIVDPRTAGLLVTPNKLILPPGATKVIRLVKMGRSEQERVYRIAAKPVTGGVEEATHSGLKIMVGYEILAIVYPDAPAPQLDVERQGQMLTVRNTGNTNVLMREGYQCAEAQALPEECTPLPSKRMYPGNEWQLQLPHDLPVKYYQSVGTRNSVAEYP